MPAKSGQKKKSGNRHQSNTHRTERKYGNHWRKAGKPAKAGKRKVYLSFGDPRRTHDRHSKRAAA